jgi:tRNA(Ile)-lysidine synthase TilS/MesJ
MSKSNITYLKDLPYLEELETFEQAPIMDNSQYNKVSKYIRNHNNNSFPDESGMSPSYHQEVIQQKINQYENNKTMINDAVENFDNNHSHSHPHPHHNPHYQSMNFSRENFQDDNKIQENYRLHASMLELNCINVAEHAKNCIVCSKIYKKNDMIYIFIIILLVVICIFLLKKILTEK